MKVRGKGVSGNADISQTGTATDLAALYGLHVRQMRISCKVSVAMVYDDLVAKSLAGAYDLAYRSVGRSMYRLSCRSDDVQSVMSYADLVERIYLVAYGSTGLCKREILYRLVHRRHHIAAVKDHFHDSGKVLLHGSGRGLDLIQLPFRIADDIRIRYGIHPLQEIDRRQRVHARSGRMEYLLVYTVILEPESLDHICKQLLLAFQLRKLTGIHPVLILQTLFRIGAEDKRKDDIIHDGKGHGHDKEHQHLADHRPCRLP